MLPHYELVFRIVVGAVLGGVIGFERDVHGHHAGLRTHLIVSMASATFMVISAQFSYYQSYVPDKLVEVDGSRIAASVVSGIGFLAGGAIIRTGSSVQGLTTAAGLWLVTAIGLGAGAGMYIESITATLLGIITLTFLRRFEDKNEKIVHRQITLVLDNEPEIVSRVIKAVEEAKFKVRDFDYEKRLDENRVILTLDVRIPPGYGVNKVIELIEKQEGLRHVRVNTRK